MENSASRQKLRCQVSDAAVFWYSCLAFAFGGRFGKTGVQSMIQTFRLRVNRRSSQHPRCFAETPSDRAKEWKTSNGIEIPGEWLTGCSTRRDLEQVFSKRIGAFCEEAQKIDVSKPHGRMTQHDKQQSKRLQPGQSLVIRHAEPTSSSRVVQPKRVVDSTLVKLSVRR